MVDLAHFGIISFTSEARVSKFVDDLEKGRIMATRCRVCGAKYFPPQADCSKCLSSEVEWFELNPDGKLLTYTVVRFGPAGFETRSPYVIAIVELGDGLRMLGHVDHRIPEEEVRIGMKLRAVPVRLDGDRITYEFQREDRVRDT